VRVTKQTWLTIPVLGCLVGIASVGGTETIVNQAASATAPAGREPAGAVLVGAGDIAGCDDLDGASATAALIERTPGTVFALGDLAYPDGSDQDFANCYHPTWGRFKNRTRPAPGNHEYHLRGASGYARYFGALAGDATKGYYSYDLGAWHILVLNSECADAGGCGPSSPQGQWIRQDLAAHPATCALAYFHKPLFSSGKHGNDPAMKPLWQAMYPAGVDVVLNGHDHNYERFAPQDPDGRADAARGIRAFVVGTGGKSLRKLGNPKPNSEVRSAKAYGVLKLTLHASSYEWEFLAEAGKSFADRGSGTCH